MDSKTLLTHPQIIKTFEGANPLLTSNEQVALRAAVTKALETTNVSMNTPDGEMIVNQHLTEISEVQLAVGIVIGAASGVLESRGVAHV